MKLFGVTIPWLVELFRIHYQSLSKMSAVYNGDKYSVIKCRETIPHMHCCCSHVSSSLPSSSHANKLQQCSKTWSSSEIWHTNIGDKPDGSWRWQAVDLSWQDRQHHMPQCVGSISHWDMCHSQWVNLSSLIANWSSFWHVRWGRTGICCRKKSVHTSSVAHSISEKRKWEQPRRRSGWMRWLKG